MSKRPTIKRSGSSFMRPPSTQLEGDNIPQRNACQYLLSRVFLDDNLYALSHEAADRNQAVLTDSLQGSKAVCLNPERGFDQFFASCHRGESISSLTLLSPYRCHGKAKRGANKKCDSVFGIPLWKAGRG